MSQWLELLLVVTASWMVMVGGCFAVLRWLILRQHDERSDLLDRLQEMVGTIHHYQVAAHAPGPDSGRAHYNEEQEDVLARTDELTKSELEAALAEAEFMGTEIELEQG
jgi:hypothetical protein